MSDSIKRSSSGEHPIMQSVRAKMASIREGQLPELEALNRRAERLKAKSDPPKTETPPPLPDEDEEATADTEPAPAIPQH